MTKLSRVMKLSLIITIVMSDNLFVRKYISTASMTYCTELALVLLSEIHLSVRAWKTLKDIQN